MFAERLPSSIGQPSTLHRSRNGGMFGDVDEHRRPTEHVPHPLVRVVVGVVQGELLLTAPPPVLRGSGVEVVADGLELGPREHPGDGADAVLAEVVLGALGVIGGRRQRGGVDGRHVVSSDAVQDRAALVVDVMPACHWSSSTAERRSMSTSRPEIA